MELCAALHPHGSLPLFNSALVYEETQGKGPRATGESTRGPMAPQLSSQFPLRVLKWFEESAAEEVTTQQTQSM